MDPALRRLGATLLFGALVAAGIAVAFVGFLALLVIVPVMALGFVLLRLWVRMRFRDVGRQAHAYRAGGPIIEAEAIVVDETAAPARRLADEPSGPRP